MNLREGTRRPMAPHLYLPCEHCPMPMQLPTETLRWLFADPKNLPNDIHAIATLCPHCKHLDSYIVHKNSPGYNLANRAVDVPLRGETVCERLLRCEEETCNIRLPLNCAVEPTHRPRRVCSRESNLALGVSALPERSSNFKARSVIGISVKLIWTHL